MKIIVVCKVCNKEQSSKFSNNWKSHYLTHADQNEKPHKCHICRNAFVTTTQLKSHMKRHNKEIAIKPEQYQSGYSI